MQDIFLPYSLQETEASLELSRIFIMEFLCEDSKLLIIFLKMLHHVLLIGFLNMSLCNTVKKIRHGKDISPIITV